MKFIIAALLSITLFSCDLLINSPADKKEENKISSDVDLGKELMEEYSAAYARDFDLFECYILMSRSARSKMEKKDLMTLQLMYDTPLYKKIGKYSKWVVKPMGHSKGGDSLIYQVDIAQIDISKVMASVLPHYRKEIKQDTIQWLAYALPIAIDTTVKKPLVYYSRQYLVTKEKSQLVVNPATAEEYF